MPKRADGAGTLTSTTVVRRLPRASAVFSAVASPTASRPTSGPTPAVAALRKELLDASLAAAQQLWQARMDQWKTLETKAQGTVAIAGIFLGGVFSMANAVKSNSGMFERVVLTLTSGALLLAVANAIHALQVRSTAFPGGSLHETVEVLLRPERAHELAERVPLFAGDRARDWRACAKELVAVNAAKAVNLRRAQWALLASALLVGLLIGQRIIAS